MRYLGTFLADPLDVPTVVVDFLAEQLEIADPSCVKSYAERQATQWEHTAEIRREFGYRDFADAADEVDEFLAARAWTRVETSKALFDATVTVSRWAVVRPFLPLLAEAIPFGATPAGQPVLDAVAELPELIGRKKVRISEIREDLVVGSWRKLVTAGEDLEPGCVDKHAYALCVLEALHRALRHREVFARDSKRWTGRTG